MNIRGKVALITGGGSGIGRATAVRLAREGAAVAVADLDDAGSRETVALIEQAGGTAIAIHADVADPTQARRMLDVTAERLGGLDILHNNAGVTTGTLDFSQATIEQWQRVLDINLRAVILGTHLALPVLRRRGGGVIVHTASMAAYVAFPPDPVYAATKAAIVMFTQCLAPLAAEGIRVNCVCPGIVDTPMLTRAQGYEKPAWLEGVVLLQPEEIADAVVQLITDDALAGRALRLMPGMRDLAPPPELPTGLR